MKKHVIYRVEPGSIAEELELEPGDKLLGVNGNAIEDVFDYQYFTNEEYLTVSVEKKNGEEWELEIEKEYEEDLGLEFENGLMDDYRSCRNKCIFCFIDQMPKGMRDTLYFKDDDSRLSFLQGNYVTLTNMREEDIDRIIAYRLGPINISVHTTNPELRCKMLTNRFAGEALLKMRRLYEAEIPMNGQIVLCKGINDGQELERSIRDLTEYLPFMESLSVVPVGLSRFREGLYPLEPFDREDAREVLRIIHRWQKQCHEKYGTHFIHASDEWYLLAEEPLPEEENYDGYPQLENGVGMLRLLETEFMEALAGAGQAACGQAACGQENTGAGEKACGQEKAGAGEKAPGQEDACAGGKVPGQENAGAGQADLGRAPSVISIATGLLAAPHIERLAGRFMERFPERIIRVYPIENRFFGELITVSGLLTGQDILEQLRGKELGEKLLLPCSLLRSQERDFLDDMTLSELENALQVPVTVVESNGRHLVECLL